MSLSNDEVMLFKRFFEGFKITLVGVNESKHRITILTLFALPKVLLIPTEILHFDWEQVYTYLISADLGKDEERNRAY